MCNEGKRHWIVLIGPLMWTLVSCLHSLEPKFLVAVLAMAFIN